jgi:WD40 repeat protein
MADDRLRELERRAATTGQPADVAAVQHERRRLGLIVPGAKRQAPGRGGVRVAFLPDGRVVVEGSASSDSLGFRPGGLRVWNPATGDVRPVGPSLGCNAAMAPKGWSVVVAERDEEANQHRLALWDLELGRAIWSADHGPFPLAWGHRPIAWSPSGDRIALGASDRSVHIIDAASGRTVCAIACGRTTDVAWLGDGERLLLTTTNASSRQVGVWHVRGGLQAHLEGHAGRVDHAVVAPDGVTGVTAGVDGTIRVWDLDRLESSGLLEGRRKAVTCLAVNPVFRRVISGSRDGSVRVWDLPTRSEIDRLEDLGSRQRPRPRRGPDGQRWHSLAILDVIHRGIAISQDGVHAASVRRTALTLWTLRF